MAEMRAAVYNQYGGPDVLHEAIIDVPLPQANELLVRVAAASVNGYDTIVRSGALKLFSSRRFPKQTGLDFVGVVETTSSKTPRFKRGDRVWGTMPLHQLGSIAEFVCVEPRQVAHAPACLASTDAAALPVVGATALIAVRDVGLLQSGRRLLVRGASGGVGSAAVQIGKALNAHVTGLASATNLEFVRELGADEALDYAKAAPNDFGRFDVILDTVGSNVAAWRRLLAPGGRMVAIVPDPNRPIRSILYFAFSRIHGTRRVRYINAKPDTAVLQSLADLVAQGTVRAFVDVVHPLSCIAEAHRAFEIRSRRGKQIICFE